MDFKREVLISGPYPVLKKNVKKKKEKSKIDFFYLFRHFFVP